ncbi:MAG: tRNA pseudouridine(38-40) synthase TruA [Bacteroidota bacterium]
MRYFIELSYFGSAYHGWQRQPNAITVQEVVEEGLATILRSEIPLVGAGRTDTGVHARQMYAHFDLDDTLETTALPQRLNAYLPQDISVHRIKKVRAEAHARFDAIQRTYEYWLVGKKDPFLKDSAHQLLLPLDLEAMNEAAEIILGYDDFECFSKAHSDVKTFICEIRRAVWQQKEEKLVFTITADRFLRNMVRAIVGTLLDVGLAKTAPEELRQIIEGKDRSKAGASVPAKGLYLTEVMYPEDIFI